MDNHQVTGLPIMLELLSEHKHTVITELNKMDISSYLIRTGPIIIQFQGVKNNKDEVGFT